MLKGILAEQNLSLDRLNSFLEIIEHGSIADAVDRDPSRQSLYSKHKKDLENVFGVKLFEQKNRKLTPTEYGKELAAVVRSFEKSLNDLDQKFKQERAVVSIGAGDAVFQWVLMPQANTLQDAFSEVSFRFSNQRTQQIVEGVKNNALDFGIVRGDVNESEITSIRLKTLEFGLFYFPPGERELSLVEVLRSIKLIGLTGKGSYVRNTIALQRSLGVDEGFWIQFDSLPMVENSLTETLSAAILPLETKAVLETIGFKTIEGAAFNSFSREYYLIVNNQNLQMRSKIREIKDHLAATLV